MQIVVQTAHLHIRVALVALQELLQTDFSSLSRACSSAANSSDSRTTMKLHKSFLSNGRTRQPHRGTWSSSPCPASRLKIGRNTVRPIPYFAAAAPSRM